MPETQLPKLIVWANSATEDELRAWVHDRLHGRDRRWIDSDDGFSVPSYMIALAVRHPETSAVANAAIVQAVCRFVRQAVGEWVKLGDRIPGDAMAGGWTAAALIDLLFLSAEILESMPRRAEMRELLIREASSLPLYSGKLPLRAKALVVLTEFGGHSDKEFWLAQIRDDYPEATPIAFLGLAIRDLDQALAWLGTRELEEQGQLIRNFRPTLVKMAGGEIPFVILARQHVFRSNLPRARELRDELVPKGDQAVFIAREDLAAAEAMGGRALPQYPNLAGQSQVIVLYCTRQTFDKAVMQIAITRYEREFGATPAVNKVRSAVLAKYLRSILPSDHGRSEHIDRIMKNVP